MSDIFPAGAKIDVTADSYEAAAEAALQWNIDTTQLERGRYHFCIQAVHTRCLQLGRSWRSLGTRVAGHIPKGTVVLAFSLNPEARVQFRGHQVQAGDLIVQESARGLDFSFIGKIDIISIAVSRDELNRRAQLHWGKPFPSESRTGLLRFTNAEAAAIAKWDIADALTEHLENAEILALDEPARRLENRVLDGLFSNIEDYPKARGSVDRHRVARAAADWMHKHCREDVCLEDLCDALDAKRRTLHLGFVELYGMPPMKYLRALRLCGVRGEISRSGAPGLRVTNVATAWGFSHLGRFAGAYRDFFGELPSQR